MEKMCQYPKVKICSIWVLTPDLYSVMMLAGREVTMEKMVYSKHKAEIACAIAGISMSEVNERAGFGPNYIYRLDGENITLKTVNRIAHAIGVPAVELMDVTNGNDKTAVLA